MSSMPMRWFNDTVFPADGSTGQSQTLPGHGEHRHVETYAGICMKGQPVIGSERIVKKMEWKYDSVVRDEWIVMVRTLRWADQSYTAIVS